LLTVFLSGFMLTVIGLLRLDRGNPQPGHEADNRAEGAVGLVELPETGRVLEEQRRNREPQDGGHALRQVTPPPLRRLAKRPVAVDRLFQLNLRLNAPDDPVEGSFGRLIISIPFHCPIRLTLQFLERGDVVGAAGT
jgi:hypothetical protein